MYIDNFNLKLIPDDDSNWTCSHTYEELEEIGGIDSEQWNSFEPLFEDEVWKSLSLCGFNNYCVSNYGRILQKEYAYSYVSKSGKIATRTQPARIVRNVLMKTGYYIVSIYKEGHIKRNISSHRIVCFMFNPLKRPSSLEQDRNEEYDIVDHLDTNRKNNIATNLIWSNYELNMRNEVSKKKMSDSKKRISQVRFKFELDNFEGTNNDNIEDYIQNESSRWFSLIDFKGEIWKPVPGFKNAYASNYGRVKKMFGNRKDDTLYIPHYTLGNHGYFIVYLDKHPYTVHRIVYMSFHNDIDKNLVIDHIDTVKTNNNINNLRQVTRFENNNNELSTKKNKKHRTPSTMKPVVLYSLVTGERLGEFGSQKQCADYLNVVSVIGSTLKKIHIVAYLYIAIFKDCEEEFMKQNLLEGIMTKRINQYGLDGKFIKTFDTSFYITDDYQKRKSIFKCCNGKSLSAYGYQWRWFEGKTDDIEDITSTIKNHMTIQNKNIAVYSWPDMVLLDVCENTTEVYNKFGILKPNALDCCNGHRKNIGSETSSDRFFTKFVDKEEQSPQLTSVHNNELF